MTEPTPIPHALIQKLREARHVVVLTGAGISAESGIPTFREAQTGLWAQYDPQQLATPRAFRQNPRLVWEWYAWRRQLVADAQPNPGHYALAEIEKRAPHFTLITQNVDGLHRQSGVKNLIEMHGNLASVKCLDEDRVVDGWEEVDEPPPRCPDCGGLLRPNVVWFGEALPEEALVNAIRATHAADLFITVGTSAIVYPAAALPIEASQHGAITVEVNPSPTALSEEMDFILRGPAGVLLPALVKATWPEANV
jgi:NAD-dependent deacetylase